jgi:hypothetical protein
MGSKDGNTSQLTSTVATSEVSNEVITDPPPTAANPISNHKRCILVSGPQSKMILSACIHTMTDMTTWNHLYSRKYCGASADSGHGLRVFLLLEDVRSEDRQAKHTRMCHPAYNDAADPVMEDGSNTRPVLEPFRPRVT